MKLKPSEISEKTKQDRHHVEEQVFTPISQFECYLKFNSQLSSNDDRIDRLFDLFTLDLKKVLKERVSIFKKYEAEASTLPFYNEISKPVLERLKNSNTDEYIAEVSNIAKQGNTHELSRTNSKQGGIEQTTDNIKRIITEIKNNKLTIKQSQEAAVDQIRRMIRDMNKIDSMPNKKTNVGHRETLSKSTFGLYNEAINYYNGQFKNVADKSIDDVVDLIGKGVENMEIIGKYSFSRFPSSYELFNKTTKKIVDGLIDDSVNFSMDIKDIKSRIKEKIGDIKFPIINQEEMYNNSASKDSGSKVSEFKKKSTPAPVSSDLPDTINNSQALIDAYIDTCSDTNNIEIDLEIKKLEEHITKLANQGNAEKFKIIQNFDAEDDSKMISVSVNDIVIKLSEETGGWIRVHSLKQNKAGWIPNDCL